MKTGRKGGLDRRAFLGAAGAASLTLARPGIAQGTPANSAIQVGIIGCGGRGTYVGGIFSKNTTCRITALCDPFENRRASLQGRFGVDKKACFGGLDGYQGLLASGVDAVIVTSPPYFHPEHARAGIRAGKHVWCAKPVCVDIPGAKSFIESGKLAAQKKQSLFVDFQTRNSEPFLEVVRRIRKGDIGEIVSGQIYYQVGRLAPRCNPSDKSPRGRLCNWVFDKRISGDIIVEQNVHVLDVSDWYLDQRPVKAFGTGGRKARVDVGDCWDHFICTYWYPGGQRIDFSSGQYLKGYGDLCMRVYGKKGTVDSHYGGRLAITGEHPWPGVEKDRTGYFPVIRNAKAFEEGIRTGKPRNNAEQAAQSTITAILGRTAAYEERVVTREEILAADVKIEAELGEI